MLNDKKMNNVINAIMNEIDNVLCDVCDRNVDCDTCDDHDDTFRSMMFDVSTTTFVAHNDNDDDEMTYCDMLISTM